MTVSFGSIKNVSSALTQQVVHTPQSDKIMHCHMLNMHFDNKTTPDLEYVQKLIPDFEENDTLTLSSLHDPSDETKMFIEINGNLLSNDVMSSHIIQPFKKFLFKVIKSTDEQIKPTDEFIKSGRMLLDVYRTPKMLELLHPQQNFSDDIFANPKNTKLVAKDIIDHMNTPLN